MEEYRFWEITGLIFAAQCYALGQYASTKQHSSPWLSIWIAITIIMTAFTLKKTVNALQEHQKRIIES